MKPGERFLTLASDFVKLEDGDENRPTWAEVEAAQRAYLDSLPESIRKNVVAAAPKRAR